MREVKEDQRMERMRRVELEESGELRMKEEETDVKAEARLLSTLCPSNS